ncbi:alpha/beta fold hydrolase [Paenibacillus validus]|uniref:alpha/beta hydrolase family protein n=1 Tax=Paenibacillus validus TaxID=44253 RepID=UPI000FD81300|nr:alpha/beta fold hydrolase [Paenibacillus validus]MED4602662.1 alpha/beta fold hydrolase [Paenibacillus validus]MED4608215.1 alpha/beta fold hydrolase [Paenibacillus validus]
MRLIFQDQTFSFELLRTLSYAPYGGADIGECLSTAYRIKEGDFESWYTEWYRTAERIHALAVDSLERGKRVSARECYLRAHNYYRTAEFFLHGNPKDPRILETWGKSRSTFRQAIKLMDTSVEEVAIPYEGTYLPGYYYRVDDTPRPTLLIHGGFDSTGEELYLEVAAAALQRGYNCLTFEGPGQGAVIREQHIPFRYDWEKVVTPVVDYLLTRPDVDPDRIALMGISLGGYLAPRAAAYEHRLAACIANDGLFSNQFGEIARKLHRGNDEDLNNPAYVEKFLEVLTSQYTGVRWAIENGMFTYQAESVHELIRKTEPVTLEGVAHKIKCPTLVCEAEADHFFAGQPKMLYDALTCPKTFMLFTAEDGAEEHCHFGALLYFNQRVFEWLDETLDIK